MSIGIIASLILTLIKIGLAWFENHKAQVQQQIGEDREKLRQFTAMNELSSTLRGVDERFAKMTDGEIKSEIENRGDFRD